MVLIQNSCHECHNLIPFKIGQTAINNKLRWYISYSCPFCGSSMEFDGIGYSPEEIRQEILKDEGEWEIIIENFNQQKQNITKSLRKILELSALELHQKLKTLRENPSILYSGTQSEMEWLYTYLKSDGIESIVLQPKIAERMNSSTNKFDIWVEIDEYSTTEEQHFDDEFCNAIIQFLDGSRIGLNIWSEKYFSDRVKNLEWVEEQVAILPNLVVRDFNASSIRQAITNLVNKHNWLEGRGFPYQSDD